MLTLNNPRVGRVLALLGFLILALTITNAAHAQTQPLIVLIPDTITGQVEAKLNSNTDDTRLVEVCIHRIDQNSPDPEAKVGCAPYATGQVPLDASEEAPSGEGLVYRIPFTVVLIPNQDQIFVARNYADVGGGTILVSADSANSALLPQPVSPPIFIVRAP